MPQYVFGNFFATELTVGITSLTTTLQVPPSATLLLEEFDALDNKEARLTLWDGQQQPEIVGCTVNPQNGTLTVVRGKEGTTALAWAAGTQVISTLTGEIINSALQAYFDFNVVLAASFLKLTGGTLTGPLILSADPADPLGAATKNYVDSVQGTGLPLSGGTMQGDINMNGNDIINLPTPTVASNPATKAYADALVLSPTQIFDDMEGSLVAGGTAAAYTVASNDLPGSYINGQVLNIKFGVTNSAGATLNMDGLGAKALRVQAGTAIPANYLVPGSPTQVTYDAVENAFMVNSVQAVRGSNVLIIEATAETASAPGDLLLVHDISAVNQRKMTIEDVFMAFAQFTAETAPALADVIPIFDNSAGDVRVMTPDNFLKILNLLTEDTTPHFANDFVLSYDASAGGVKKVKVSNLRPKKLQMREQLANNAAASGLTGGVWNTRSLNTTVVNTIPSATHNTGTFQFSLPAGTYRISGGCASIDMRQTVSKLFNTTDGTDTVISLWSSFRNAGGAVGHALNTFDQEFTIADTKTFEIRTNGLNTGANYEQTNFGVVSIICDITIEWIG